MNTKTAIIILIVCFFHMSCGVTIPLIKNKDKLSQLDLLMTQDEVRESIGDPDEVRGSVINVDGDVVSVWQYDLYNKSSGWKNLAAGFFLLTMTWWIPNTKIVYPHSYWIYFVDKRLAQWGRAGNWQPGVIKKIRIEND